MNNPVNRTGTRIQVGSAVLAFILDLKDERIQNVPIKTRFLELSSDIAGEFQSY